MSGVRVEVPGDKSISHRMLILAALSDGPSRLKGVPESLDVASTVRCLRSLGARIDLEAGESTVEGSTPWRSPAGPLDCGNSGTTARLVTGLAAGLGLRAEIRGDRSLNSRPMDRIVYPLQAMGARILYEGEVDRLPVRIEPRSSGDLRRLRYRPRVSSAQVRGALLLAAITARSDLEILDRGRPRDHTERLLSHMGAPITASQTDGGDRVRLRASGWQGSLRPLNATVPGDVSSAAFLVVAGLLGNRGVVVERVGLNPRRTGFVQVLRRMGARIEAEVSGEEAGEPIGSVRATPGPLTPFEIGPADVPSLVDEIPILVALASRVPGISIVRGAAELRVKESDRLALLASNLTALGVNCDELPDGLEVYGTDVPLQGRVSTRGDHRIAMAFGVLAGLPDSDIEIDQPECVDVSFPGFWRALDDLRHGRAP